MLERWNPTAHSEGSSYSSALAAAVNWPPELISEHKRHWRKDVIAPGAERVLMEITIARLEALRLVRRVAGGVRPLPAIARYALANELAGEITDEPEHF